MINQRVFVESNHQRREFVWVLDKKMSLRVLRSFETDRPGELILKEDEGVRVRKRPVSLRGEAGEGQKVEDGSVAPVRRRERLVSESKKAIKSRKDSGSGILGEVLKPLFRNWVDTSEQSFLKELGKGFPVKPPGMENGERRIQLSKANGAYPWKIDDNGEDIWDQPEDALDDEHELLHQLTCPLCPYGTRQERISTISRPGDLIDSERRYSNLTKATTRPNQPSIATASLTDSINSHHTTEAHQSPTELTPSIKPTNTNTSNTRTLHTNGPLSTRLKSIQTSSPSQKPTALPDHISQTTLPLRRSFSTPLPSPKHHIHPINPSNPSNPSQPLPVQRLATFSTRITLKRRASDAAGGAAVQAQGFRKKCFDGLLRTVGKRKIERVEGGVVVRKREGRWDLDGREEVGDEVDEDEDEREDE